MFKRREQVRFFKPKGDLSAIYGAATEGVGPHGVDSLDFLAAAVAAGSVERVLRKLGVDRAALAGAAADARDGRQPGPGLTDDAKRLVEAVAHRSIERRRDPAGPDLLVAMTAVDTPAQAVLLKMGVDEAHVRAIVD